MKNMRDNPTKPSQKTPRILIIRLDYIGDMLCTTALMSAIRDNYPNCYLAVLAHSYNRSVIEHNTDIDAVFQYIFSRQLERNPHPGKISSLIDRLKLVLKLRAIHFDYVIIPNGGRYMSSIQFAWQLGAKHVFFIDESLAFDDRIPEHVETRLIEHETLAGFRVSGDLLKNINPEDYKLQLNLPTKNNLVQRVQNEKNLPIIGLNFSARVPERSWSLRNWCKLAVVLAKNNQLYIFGTPEMWDDPQFKAEASKSGLYELSKNSQYTALVRTKTFLEMAEVISDCDILISTDGGAVHVAAALKKPAVVLFENRPEKYNRWYPWGVEYTVVTSKTSAEVEGITINDVVNGHEKLMAKISLQKNY
ncbi:MAG: glycosyltransferase family 9 protein [Betaproteobacteria bacterium]